jgi:hypothetical protein
MMAQVSRHQDGTVEGGNYVVLVGDIQGSKQFSDQKRLFTWLREQFDWVNQHQPAVQPLRFTVGDEFQAAYRDMAAAFQAVILLRLRFKSEEIMSPFHSQDVRIGMAYGEISVFDRAEEPFGQSGGAWWNARSAIEKAEQPKNSWYLSHSHQTWFHGLDPLQTAITNSFWLAFDQVLYQMDRKDVQITLQKLIGKKQKDIAESVGISQPMVSRRSKTKGAYTVFGILEELRRASG